MTIPLDATVAERAAYLRESGIWSALTESVLLATAAAMQPAVYETGELIIRHG